MVPRRVALPPLEPVFGVRLKYLDIPVISRYLSLTPIGGSSAAGGWGGVRRSGPGMGQGVEQAVHPLVQVADGVRASRALRGQDGAPSGMVRDLRALQLTEAEEGGSLGRVSDQAA